MDRALFDEVQEKLTEQWSHRNHAKSKSDHLLTGILFDDAGHRMVPTHATKAGIRHRYYISAPHLNGESRTASVGLVSRVPAVEIEDIVVKSLSQHRQEKSEGSLSEPAQPLDRKAILKQIARI